MLISSMGLPLPAHLYDSDVIEMTAHMKLFTVCWYQIILLGDRGIGRDDLAGTIKGRLQIWAIILCSHSGSGSGYYQTNGMLFVIFMSDHLNSINILHT